MCDGLFKGFKWGDLRRLSSKELPTKPGVYVLRLVVNEYVGPADLRERVGKAYSKASALLDKAGWRELSNYFGKRVERIRRIDPVKCPVIYIGATGKGTGTLRSRFRDLAGLRHTIFYPVFSLILAGWDIDFGWTEAEDAFNVESRLKRQYIEVHGDMPALNKG